MSDVGDLWDAAMRELLASDGNQAGPASSAAVPKRRKAVLRRPVACNASAGNTTVVVEGRRRGGVLKRPASFLTDAGLCSTDVVSARRRIAVAWRRVCCLLCASRRSRHAVRHAAMLQALARSAAFAARCSMRNAFVAS